MCKNAPTRPPADILARKFSPGVERAAARGDVIAGDFGRPGVSRWWWREVVMVIVGS